MHELQCHNVSDIIPNVSELIIIHELYTIVLR